jgi:hypothetical protein
MASPFWAMPSASLGNKIPIPLSYLPLRQGYTAGFSAENERSPTPSPALNACPHQLHFLYIKVINERYGHYNVWYGTENHTTRRRPREQASHH